MTQTQEEADHQFALMLSREAYYDDANDYYGIYDDFEDAKKKNKRKSLTRDDEWNPEGKKPKKAIKKTPVSQG